MKKKRQEQMMNRIDNGLYFKRPIMRWDEALPLGNGLLGCLVWGGAEPLNFSLDRGDIWDNRPAPETLDKEFTYEKLIGLVKGKKQEEIVKRFDQFYFQPTPTKLPAGRLELTFGRKPDVVESRLRFDTAKAEVALHYGSECCLVTSWLHAVKKIGWIRVKSAGDMPKLRIKAPECLKEILSYPAFKEYEKDRLAWVVQEAADGLQYGIFTYEKCFEGGKDIVYFVGSSNDGEDWVENAEGLIREALDTGYESLLESHVAWWAQFWRKSSVSLPDPLFENQWKLTNYLFGSCSRKGCPPMPLQGVWTADEGRLPPWKGDYHHDLNTQLSYMHYFKANHLEEGESFIDFLWELVPEAREFAKSFFDAPGLCLPSVMTIKGKPLGGWAMYSINLTNQIWLCQSFDLHWRYTGDDEFLKNRAYPYFKETALCILRWLKPDENGKLKLPVSASPEIHDNRIEAWLAPNSSYDLALLIYLFETLSEYAAILKEDDKEKWKQCLKQLDSLCVNKDNVLMLNHEESLRETHRHHSHAMAIYPLRLLKYESNPRDREIINATVNNLELLGTGLWCGYSYAWMAEFYAVQGNGEGAAYQLKLFWENFCSPNGFHLNSDYKKRGLCSTHGRPFTLEGNMCAADALQEMLLRTDSDGIRVFPAIPEDWKREGASFDDLRGWNGVLVSAGIKDEKLAYIKLKALKNGNYSVYNDFAGDTVIVQYSDRNIPVKCTKGETFQVAMKKGEECSITGGSF